MRLHDGQQLKQDVKHFQPSPHSCFGSTVCCSQVFPHFWSSCTQLLEIGHGTHVFIHSWPNSYFLVLLWSNNSRLHVLLLITLIVNFSESWMCWAEFTELPQLIYSKCAVGYKWTTGPVDHCAPSNSSSFTVAAFCWTKSPVTAT